MSDKTTNNYRYVDKNLTERKWRRVGRSGHAKDKGATPMKADGEFYDPPRRVAARERVRQTRGCKDWTLDGNVKELWIEERIEPRAEDQDAACQAGKNDKCKNRKAEIAVQPYQAGS